MKDPIRPESSPAQVDSGVKTILVKESGGQIYRMRWSGGGYAIVAPPIQVFEGSSLTPATLEASQEATAIWRPAAKRYEIIKGMDGEPGEGGESLFAEFTATATSSRASDTITADIVHYWGGTPAGTTGVTVHKLSDHDVTLYQDDKFYGVWDSDEEEWKLFWFDGLRITVKGTIDNEETDVTPSTGSFSLTGLSLVSGWRLPGSITVTNDPPIYAADGATVYARFNLTLGSNPLTSWDTGDGGNFLGKLKGVGGWNDGGSIQFMAAETADDPEWVTPDGHDVDELQVPGHLDGATDLDWITARYIEIDLT